MSHPTRIRRALGAAALLCAAATPLRAQSCAFDVEIKTSFLNTWQRTRCVTAATVPAGQVYHVYFRPLLQAPVSQVLLANFGYLLRPLSGTNEYRADVSYTPAGAQYRLDFVTTSADGSKRLDTLAIGVPAPPPPAPVAQVVVSPATATLYIDGADAVQLAATTKDAYGTVLTGRAVTWASGDATIASVTTDGYVIAARAGIVTLRATSEGQTGAAQITVKAPRVVTSGSQIPPLER